MQVTQTEIGYWLTCRRKHDLAYRKLLKPDGLGYGAMEFGHDVHRWVEMVHNGVDLSEVEGSIASSFADYPDDQHMLKRYGMALGYLSLIGKYDFLDVENIFSIPVGDNRFVGKIDGAIFEDSQWCLYELKTTGRAINDAWLESLKHSLQAKAYCWALERMYGVRVDRVVYEILSTRCNLRVKRNQTFEEYLSEVRQYVEDRPDAYRVVYNAYVDWSGVDKVIASVIDEIETADNIVGNANMLLCPGCEYRRACQTGYEGGFKKLAKHEELIT